MFEKEAEENGFGIGCTVNPTIAFQKGAEFGYNKANEEQEETIDTLSKRIREQQKTIGSLTDMIDELKAQIEKNEVLSEL